MIRSVFPLLVWLTFWDSFSSVAQQKLFSLVKPDSSGIGFQNVILDDKTINIIDYLYFYNGAGVSIGDVNNDGLPDIFFVSNRYSCKLYLNKGNLKFEDVTEKAGVAGEPGTYKTGVVMVDINNDGWMDIYLCRSASKDPELRRNILYVNNKNGTFTNQAKAYGLDDDGYSTNGYFNDSDGDGDLDLLVVNHPYNFVETDGIHLTYNKKRELVAARDSSLRGESDRFYENVNGKYVDRTKQAGLRTRAFGLSAIFQDFNDDGKPDIYQANDFLEPDYLFINKGNNLFVNEFDQYFRHGSYFSMGTDYADLNNDGFSDLIVTDMLPTDNRRRKQLQRPSNYDQFDKQVKYGFGYQYLKNVVQLNNGNNTYSDVGYLTGMAYTDWSWAVLINDFDNDGLKDVYIANGMPRDIHDLDYVRFKTDSIRKEIIKLKNGNDILKLLSIIPTVRVQKHYFKNYGGLLFRKESAESGLEQFAWSFGAAYGDLDGDGDLEIVVNNINDFAFVYKNNTIEHKAGNSLKIQLEGPSTNKMGIGAQIVVETPDKVKTTTVFNPMKGYLSSHDKTILAGIGKNENATVTVTWPDGQSQQLQNLKSGQLYNLKYFDSKPVQPITIKPGLWFSDITANCGLNFSYEENEYIDFKMEPLLPHRFSQLGPCLAVADVNGDGLEDFFIGGAKDKVSHIFVQNLDSTFSEKSQSCFSEVRKFEDGAATFLDADADGDLDLVVTSGGNEYPNQLSKYPIRLYLNDGYGNFKESKMKKAIYTSSSTIAGCDYNKDGKPDVFVGGRVVPGHYGRIPNSYLLTLQGDTFIEMVPNEALNKIGMVTSSIWADLDKDGWEDLVVVGEWMAVSIFFNKKGELSNIPIVLDNSKGWWNRVAAADIDLDGDLDLIGGNLGYNTRYRGSKERPATMIVNDFDNNGSTDCMISVFNRDKSYPMALRDNLLDQMPYLRKKYLRYKSYSDATLTDIFSVEQIESSLKFQADNMASLVFYNDGKGNFIAKELPLEAQIFPVQGIQVSDLNKDSIPDILLCGNDYATEVETGRNDAGIGLVLLGKGNQTFSPVEVTKSNFYIPGDSRCMEKIRVGHHNAYLIGKNKSPLQLVGNPKE